MATPDRPATRRLGGFVRGGATRPMVRRLRRRLPLLVLLVALAWVVTIIVLITVNPAAGTGNPMD